MTLNKRKCKECGVVFQKIRPLQSVCSPKCGILQSKKQREKQSKKDWQKRKKATKEKLKTKKDYEKELQQVFNEFIRLRDQDQNCISCGRQVNGKCDAGHFYPVGSYKNLRFDENNVHKQCVHCNQHKHGNLNEYALNLPQRIGLCNFKKLNENRLKERHYSIPELIDLKKTYKEKIKKLKQNDRRIFD